MWPQISKHWNICLSTVGMPLLLQSSETWKLTTGWLMATRGILWARDGFKWREWGWLNEKSVQCALNCNTWECLWQAFQEEDQYNSYHVSHIDHWLCIVIRVPNRKPMLLILERERQRDRKETNKNEIHNLELINFKPVKCIKRLNAYTLDLFQISSLLCVKQFQSQCILVRHLDQNVCVMHNKGSIWSASGVHIYNVDSGSALSSQQFKG